MKNNTSMQKILNQILKAKEQRHLIRQNASQNGLATISINFNVPGYPKSSELMTKVFEMVCRELKTYLNAIRLPFDADKTLLQCDDAGDICFFFFKPCDFNLVEIKNKLEYFEQNHALGRLLDVDIFDAQAKVISSKKQKSCFICKNHSAIDCMRQQRHSYESLRQYILEALNNYYDLQREEQICRHLSSEAIWAIFTEVAIPQKPGLVSPQNNGSHCDMNYQTFFASSAVISTYFYQIAQMGCHWQGNNIEATLTRLRMLGLEIEAKMFDATKGINTQKGIIFLMILILFVAAYTLYIYGKFDEALFVKHLKLLTNNLVENELLGSANKNKSNGERCFMRYGKKLAGGIRQEVEMGLPTFFKHIKPYMQQINFNASDIADEQKFNSKCKLILLKIMSLNNDTNILHRSNAETLEMLKNKSQKVLTSETIEVQKKYYDELVEFCKEKNISPGGSADLLAVSLFLSKIINQNKTF